MQVTHEETQVVDVIDDVLCDRCGESMVGSEGNINGLALEGEGASDSTHFPAGKELLAEICEACAAEWFATFKNNPMMASDPTDAN